MSNAVEALVSLDQFSTPDAASPLQREHRVQLLTIILDGRPRRRVLLSMDQNVYGIWGFFGNSRTGSHEIEVIDGRNRRGIYPFILNADDKSFALDLNGDCIRAFDVDGTLAFDHKKSDERARSVIDAEIDQLFLELVNRGLSQ